MNTKTPTAKPKKRIRNRHIKKALLITIYSFVAIVMVAGIVGPAFQR